MSLKNQECWLEFTKQHLVWISAIWSDISFSHLSKFKVVRTNGEIYMRTRRNTISAAFASLLNSTVDHIWGWRLFNCHNRIPNKKRLKTSWRAPDILNYWHKFGYRLQRLVYHIRNCTKAIKTFFFIGRSLTSL